MAACGSYPDRTATAICIRSVRIITRMNFDFAPESFGFEEAQAIPVEVKAGAIVYFNGYLLHRSFKNRSEIYRRVLVNHYMNAWSLLPWHLKEGETTANADRRGVLLAAGTDPYEWKGYEDLGKNVYLRTCKANE